MIATLDDIPQLAALDAAADHDAMTSQLGTLLANVMLAAYIHAGVEVARAFPGAQPPSAGNTQSGATVLQARDFVPQTAVEFLREQQLMTPRQFEQLSDHMRRHAFALAEVESHELIQTVHAKLVRAVRDGQTFDSWAAGVDAAFDRAGVTQRSPYHLETVFRNNTASAYSAGQWDMLHNPAVAEMFPYFRYHTVGDSNVRDEHAALNRVTLPRDDPRWRKIWPPNGHRCRCSVEPVSLEEASREGFRVVEPPPGAEKVDWPGAPALAMTAAGASPRPSSTWIDVTTPEDALGQLSHVAGKVRLDGATVDQLNQIGRGLTDVLAPRSARVTEVSWDHYKQQGRKAAHGTEQTPGGLRTYIRLSPDYVADPQALNLRLRQRFPQVRAEALAKYQQAPADPAAEEGIAKWQAMSRFAASDTSPQPLYTTAAHEAAHSLIDPDPSLKSRWRDALTRHGVTSVDKCAVSFQAGYADAELFADVTALLSDGRAHEVPANIRDAFEETLK